MKIFYAIRNKKNGKYVTGTDYRHYPPRQILCEERPPKLFQDITVETEINCRKINLNRYEVVPVVIVEKGSE